MLPDKGSLKKRVRGELGAVTSRPTGSEGGCRAIPTRDDRSRPYHIRALKDLDSYTGREKPPWVKIMAARRRKTLVLCRTCHKDIQYGHPVRRHTSSS